MDNEIDALRAEIDALKRALVFVHNFPSHPRGRAEDQSSEAECAACWRWGWACAVEAIQKGAVMAAVASEDVK